MYCSNKQVGRSRVNKIKEGKKRPPRSRELNKKDGLAHYKPRSSVKVCTNKYKVVGQLKKSNVTALDKLYNIQKDLLSEDYTFGEYEKYVQDKINNNKYYYKNLSQDNLILLHKRYQQLIKKKTNEYNERGDEMEFNRRQRKLFRKKKREIMNNIKRELINDLFKSITDSKVSGVTKNVEFLSNDPEKWNETKLCLFLGGKYIESSDKKWSGIYKKLTSINSGNILNLSNHEDINNYVIKN